MSSPIKTVAIVGTGVIGAGWAARCLAWGLDVVASDPGKDAEKKLRAAVANATIVARFFRSRSPVGMAAA